MKHSNDRDGNLVFSNQICSCSKCYKHSQTIIVAELKSLNIIEEDKDDSDIMRLSLKFVDSLPHTDNDEIELITNHDIWNTLVGRFNQSEPDAIYDYGVVIRMIIDILIKHEIKNTTNNYGGDMYGV